MTSSQAKTTGRILFRPDLSPAIGTGHLMRCLALAELCLANGQGAVFALNDCPAQLRQRVQAAGIETVSLPSRADPRDLDNVVRQVRPGALVLDGYRFDSEYRATVAALGVPVLAIDDGNLHFPLHADIVLNSSPLADAGHYAAIAPGARLLLGPAYAPLRREFLDAAPNDAIGGAAKRVLLTFGGSDPAALTTPVARALLDGLPVEAVFDVVLGAAVGDPRAIEALAAQHPNRVALHRNTNRMAALIGSARIAVSAAGSTLWELASLGVPTVAVVVADNQEGNLHAPLNAWFDTVDARHDRAHAVDQIVTATQALWQDAKARDVRRTALLAIGVGRRARDICHAIAQSGHRAA